MGHHVDVLGWGRHVTKIECANHSVKCYRNLEDSTGFPKVQENLHNYVDQLRKDLRNGPNHVFNNQ